MPRFFKSPAKPATFHSFPPVPAELTRKSQPSRTRPTSKKASAVLAAMLSVCDSNGYDDSVDWTDMVFPLDVDFPSLALDRVSMGGGFAAWRNVAEQAYLSGRFVQRAVPALRDGSMGRDASLTGRPLLIMAQRGQTDGD